MPSEIEKQFLFNHGWDHFWCDPKCVNTSAVREFIKGSFAKPKLICSIPFVTNCQQDGTPVEFSGGISDCWAAYLTTNLKFFQEYLRNYELMHREDVDVVPHLRKYRLYIGQGIPDPWTSFPYSSEIASNLKDAKLEKRLKNKKRQRCLCCEREYLFECPDNCTPDANRCSCKDCHGKNQSGSGSNEKCKCAEIFHNWPFENTNLKGRKHKRGSSGDCASTVNSQSEWEDEDRNINRNKFIEFCECIKNWKSCECSGSEISGLGAREHEPNGKTFKFRNKNDRFLKQHSKVYFCPYIKHFCRRKSLESVKGHAEQKKSESKEIQTEIQPIKSSKIVQTEKQETKSQPKCTCHNKCFYCSILCNRPRMKKGYSAVHSIPQFCCTSSFKQFLCPYSFVQHCPIEHCQSECPELKKQHRKKRTNKREREETSNINQQDATADKIKEVLQQQDLTEHNISLKYNKNIDNPQTPPTAVNHLKLLADYKLKGYLQPDGIWPGTSNNKFSHQNSNMDSRFMNFFQGNSTLSNLRQEGIPLERFTSSSYYKPKYSESSFAESKLNFRQSKILNSNVRRISYCNQATMTPFKNTENVESPVFIKDTVSNEMIDSDEPKPCGFHKNQEVTKVLKKRKKLLRNRKRRRNLVASILENPDSLTKSSKQTMNAKEAQIERIPEDYVHSKKLLNQNYTSPPNHLNFGEYGSLRFADSVPRFYLAGMNKRIQKNS